MDPETKRGLSNPDRPLLREGETCWRRARADRLSWLIDGEHFFDAVGRALADARHQVLLVGWDFHSQMKLWRSDPPVDGPAEFLGFLDHVVRKRRGLRAYALCWDYAALYSIERELLPSLRFGALSHRRIHFRFDSAHPLLASQHQKLIVIDDSIAFVGGFDLTQHRWDRRAHDPNDALRTSPSGECYRPFHDVQVMVSGDAAATVGDLARDRWERATGRSLRKPARRPDWWIDGVPIDGESIEIGLARTFPYHEERPEIREVERLYLEAIRAARRWIYIENQYLTSETIADALCSSLREPEGPEIVIIGPQRASGWLERTTMDLLRSRIAARLREADTSNRLRLCYPHIPDLDGDGLNVHAKLMVVDDRFARVGSANLSNRSMGLDSECDLAVDADRQPEARPLVSALLHELLAEHLGSSPERVADEIARRDSLIGTVDALSGSARSLRPLETDTPDWSTDVLATGAIVADPETPASWETLRALFPSEALPSPPYLGVRWWPSFLALLALGSLAALWRFTPLARGLDPAALESLAAPMLTTWYAAPLAIGIFVLLIHLMFPVTVLIVACGLIFGGWTGVLVSWIGTLISVAVGHQIGRRWLHEIVRRRAGAQVDRMSRAVADRGLLASAVLRLLPIAPFHLVNVIAGASHVRFRDFVLGSQLAMTPGIVMLVWASDEVSHAVRDPSVSNLLAVGLVTTLAIVSMLGLRSWARREAEEDA